MLQTVMHDTRWDRLRTRQARVRIVAAMTALLVAVPVAWATLPAHAALGVVAVAIAVWWVLRMSARVVADLPEAYLDERQVRVRDRAYIDAYRWFAGLTLLAATILLVWFVVVSENDVAPVEISWSQASPVPDE